MKELTFKDVSDKIGVAEPTLRRWAALLEEKGYEFDKVGARRKLNEADLRAFRKIHRLNKDKAVLLDKAIEQVAIEQVAAKSIDHKEGGKSKALEGLQTQNLSETNLKIDRFDQVIKNFRKSLYWQAESAVEELERNWAEVKVSLERIILVHTVPDLNAEEGGA